MQDIEATSTSMIEPAYVDCEACLTGCLPDESADTSKAFVCVHAWRVRS